MNMTEETTKKALRFMKDMKFETLRDIAIKEHVVPLTTDDGQPYQYKDILDACESFLYEDCTYVLPFLEVIGIPAKDLRVDIWKDDLGYKIDLQWDEILI